MVMSVMAVTLVMSVIVVMYVMVVIPVLSVMVVWYRDHTRTATWLTYLTS